MKKSYLNALAFAVITLGMVACNGEKKEGDTAAAEVVEVAHEVDPILKKGETVFKTYCLACHMSKGEGVPNLNPPLTRTTYTLGDKNVMIGIVINGLEGEIEVAGSKYNSVMTPFGFLSDEEIAGVVTYVRQSFGNDADAASVADVTAVRALQQ